MSLPESPNSNVEQYLSKISGQTSAVPEAPNSRVEQYLEYIAKNGTVSKEEIAEQVSEWLEENIHEDPTVVIDASLSVSGAAADAKAAGDEIADLKADLSESVSVLKSALDEKADVKDTTESDVDLDITDYYGNVIVRFEDGHIKTKEFDSGGLDNLLDEKQDALTFDSTPTSSSDNPVTSGGVYAALASKMLFHSIAFQHLKVAIL